MRLLTGKDMLIGSNLGVVKLMARGTGAAIAASALTLLLAGTLLAAIIASETKLTASDGAPDDRFGSSGESSSVAQSGRSAVIAATGDDDLGDRAGAAYVFHDDGTGWAEQAKLTASDGVEKDFFGSAVSMSGDTVVVGAFFSDSPAQHSGSAYVYQRTGDTWTEEAKLVADDGAEDDLFGISAAISGDAVVVGARDHDAVAPNAGAAYVFRFDGTGWTQEAELVASDGAAGDFLGVRVAIDGDVVVAGAQKADAGRVDSGAAYVFRFDGTSWTQEAKLTASDGRKGDEFGNTVAISGDTVVVGAVRVGPDRGAAYVFRFDGTSWSQEAKLTASDSKAKDVFGSSVGISGDLIVVGAAKGDDGERDTGAAYVFQRTGTVWSEELKLFASDGEQDDNFGGSVAIWQNTVLIGASGDDDLGSGAGAAYVYELTSP